MRYLLWPAALLILIQGCAASDGGASGSPEETSPTVTEAHLPAPILDPIIDQVARDAGVPRDTVVVRQTESLTFPNAGLGCPEPGMAYKQVPVDGYRVVLEAGGTTYDFRGTGQAPARRCRTIGR